MDEMIQKRARIDHGGDIVKATEAFFKDHPDCYQEYQQETVQVGAKVVEDQATRSARM